VITLLATFKLKPGAGPAFEGSFAEIKAQVLATEPETSLYKLVRSRTDPDEYRVVEFYRSAAAMAFHLDNPATKRMMGEFGAFFSCAPDVSVLDDVNVDE
jgi:quinol monooxygenase YgiN